MANPTDRRVFEPNSHLYWLGTLIRMKEAAMTQIDVAPATFSIGAQLTVRRLGFGSMRLTGPGNWGRPEDVEGAKNLLRRAVELGVNLIDTADAYGPHTAEELIREALYPYPDDLVIATKGGLTRQGPNRYADCGRPEYLRQCIEMSLRRLGREQIDLYQLHRVDSQVPIEDSIGALKEAQDEGRIRFIGLSEVSIDELRRAQKVAKIDSVQNLYNLGDRAGWKGDSEAILQLCEAEGIAFLPWAPLDRSALSAEDTTLAHLAKERNVTPSQLALAWLLHRSPNIIPIPGTSNQKHLEENLGAAAIRLSAEECQLLNDWGLDAGSPHASGAPAQGVGR